METQQSPVDGAAGAPRRVVVSGGGGAGMGAELVGLLRSGGHEVHVLDRRPSSVPGVVHHDVDLSDRGAIDEVARRVGAEPVDTLFNCVGVAGGSTTPLQTMTVNFVGVRHLTEALVPSMPAGSAVATVASRGGSAWPERLQTWLELVRTESFDGAVRWLEEHPGEFTGAYRASKEALCVWTMHSAVELGALGVRHNAVLPGPTRSPMYAEFNQTAGQAYMESFPVPLGRPQTALEQARVLEFLGSPLASGVSGALLYVDGGSNAGLTTGQLSLPAHA